MCGRPSLAGFVPGERSPNSQAPLHAHTYIARLPHTADSDGNDDGRTSAASSSSTRTDRRHRASAVTDTPHSHPPSPAPASSRLLPSWIRRPAHHPLPPPCPPEDMRRGRDQIVSQATGNGKDLPQCPLNRGMSTVPESAREDMDVNTQRLHMNQAQKAANVEISGDVHPGSGPDENISLIGNAIEHRRQRDRERCAAMSAEQMNELNKRRREVRQRNKGQNGTPNVLGDGDVEENMDPNDGRDWLHRNETYQANDIVSTRDLMTPKRNYKDRQSKKKEKGRNRYRKRIQNLLRVGLAVSGLRSSMPIVVIILIFGPPS
ncbi:hypothetical protein U9M48_043606 [Paspalum notatum var. saurae]|uniref:Uncharacterized protein n=1 Tax=Paspalum notatum var. saurae TaxID=547442 RepID=A0AAQ3UTU4_PASNO